MPGTSKVSGSNLTRTCSFFKGKYSGSKKIGLLLVLKCFIGLVARSKNCFDFAVSNFHCSGSKCFSILKVWQNRFFFNTGCNFTNQISHFFSFCLFYRVNKFRLNLY